MYAEMKMAVDAAKVAYDIAKAAKDLGKQSELLAAVTVVQEQLQAALLANLQVIETQRQLQQRISELEALMRDKDAFASLAAEYELHRFATGALAYKPTEQPKDDSPVRMLCVTCFDKKVASTLQPNGELMTCLTCKHVFRKTPMPKPPSRSVQRDPGRPW